MPLLDYAIPSVFNTLDDEPFDDGHPDSSWSGRERLHNERFLHAYARRCLLNRGWDVTNPLTYKHHVWARVAAAYGPTSPGQQTVTVALRCIISAAGRQVAWAVRSHRTRTRQRGGDNWQTWTVTTGTGAAQDVTITGVEVEAGAQELVEVFALPLLRGDAAGDVTGAVSGVGPAEVTSTAADMAWIGKGWVIRIEDGASGEALSMWRPIWKVGPGNNKVWITPGWGEWPDLVAEEDDSGASVWRARPVAELELLSVAIDEDELTAV